MGIPLDLAAITGTVVVKVVGDSQDFSDYWREADKAYFMGHYYKKYGDVKIAVLQKGADSSQTFLGKLEDICDVFNRHNVNVEIDGIMAFFAKNKMDKAFMPAFIQSYLTS